MNGNVHVVNLEYGLCVIYRYKTYIHYSDNKMNELYIFPLSQKQFCYLTFRM